MRIWPAIGPNSTLFLLRDLPIELHVLVDHPFRGKPFYDPRPPRVPQAPPEVGVTRQAEEGGA